MMDCCVFRSTYQAVWCVSSLPQGFARAIHQPSLPMVGGGGGRGRESMLFPQLLTRQTDQPL
eukprot:7568110-Karenia_brevis.AAC.1